MSPLFSTPGLRALDRLRLPRSLLALDFDGTLAPLRPEADDAFTPTDNLALVRRLQKDLPIAMISGRGRSDLRRHLGFRPKHLIGNHGLETPWPNEFAREARRSSRAWAEQLEAGWAPFAGTPAYVEDKIYSLSLHYRGAESRRRPLRQLAAKLDPPARIGGGKCVYNLTLPGGPDKGRALLELTERFGYQHVLFIGDDDTDEDAFGVRDRRLIHARVGRRASSAARFFVPHQRDVRRILEYLVKL